MLKIISLIKSYKRVKHFYKIYTLWKVRICWYWSKKILHHFYIKRTLWSNTKISKCIFELILLVLNQVKYIFLLTLTRDPRYFTGQIISSPVGKKSTALISLLVQICSLVWKSKAYKSQVVFINKKIGFERKNVKIQGMTNIYNFHLNLNLYSMWAI